MNGTAKMQCGVLSRRNSEMTSNDRKGFLYDATLLKKSNFTLLTIVLLLWGSAFPAIRASLRVYPPMHLAALRFLIASVALGCVMLAKGWPRPQKSDIPILICNGVVGVGFYNLLLNTGQLTVKAGAASLLVNTAPLWTMLWAVLYLKERPTRAGWIGLLISFLGVIIVTLRQGSRLEWNTGALLVIGASISHSIYIVLMKRNVSRYGPLPATAMAVWTGTAFLLCFSKGLTHTIQSAPLSSTLTVVYLGLGPAALAYVLWGAILERFPAAQAVSFLYLVPITALFIGWIWLKEIPFWNTLFGGVLILIGVAMVHRYNAASYKNNVS